MDVHVLSLSAPLPTLHLVRSVHDQLREKNRHIRDSARDEGREEDMIDMESSVRVTLLLLRLCTGTYSPDEGEEATDETDEVDLIAIGVDMAGED